MGVKSLADLETLVNGGTLESDSDISEAAGSDIPNAPEEELTDANAEYAAVVSDEIPSDTPVDETVEEVSSVTTEEPQETEYIPNMTYKVRDEEKVFDDRFSSVVKSKEDEEFLRDLYTKAEGLDTYKTKLGATEKTIVGLQGDLNQAADFYKTLSDTAKSGDMEKLVRSLDLKENVILDYAMKLVEESELPEDQRKERQDIRNLRHKQETIEKQNATLTRQLEDFQTGNAQQQEQQLINNQANMVNHEIERYSDVNSKLQGAGIDLFDLVVAEGHKEFLETKTEPSDIGGLVDRVVARFGKIMPASQTQQPVKQTKATRPASIPKITGDPSSPVDRRVTSLDQLKAEFDKEYGQPSFY